MWDINDHSHDDNLRWTWLRAVEWGVWPIFISQPIAPIALLALPWWSVIFATFVATLIWSLFIKYSFVAPTLAGWGAVFVRLKWLTCPIAAYLLWHRGSSGSALVALLWPLLVLFIPSLPTKTGVIQKMFIESITKTADVQDAPAPRRGLVGGLIVGVICAAIVSLTFFVNLFGNVVWNIIAASSICLLGWLIIAQTVAVIWAAICAMIVCLIFFVNLFGNVFWNTIAAGFVCWLGWLIVPKVGYFVSYCINVVKKKLTIAVDTFWSGRKIKGLRESPVQIPREQIREVASDKEDWEDAWIEELIHDSYPASLDDEWEPPSLEEMNAFDPTHPLPCKDDEWLDWTWPEDEKLEDDPIDDARWLDELE